MEAPITRLEPLVAGVVTALIPWLDKPFALFGHSVGALLAFAVAQHIRWREGCEPVHLFVSGRSAPQCTEIRPPAYNLPDDEFIERVVSFNGMSSELLANRELLELTLPVLRADFEVYETYRHTAGPLLQCPITALGGKEDTDAPPPQVEAWCEQTTGSARAVFLPGDHFFIHTAEADVLQIVSSALKQSGV